MPTATEHDMQLLRQWAANDTTVTQRAALRLLDDLEYVRRHRDELAEQLQQIEQQLRTEATNNDVDDDIDGDVWHITRHELAAFVVDVITATKTRKGNR